MVEKQIPPLPTALAELLKRMTPEEQAEFAAQLTWEQIHRLEDLKKQHDARTDVHTNGQEPHIYVSVGPDSISFEAPVEQVIPLIQRIATELETSTVVVRFPDRDSGQVLREPTAELRSVLTEEEESLLRESLIIEIDDSTLYSQGGGCLLLNTGAPTEKKRAIAEGFLQLCGYSHRVTGDRFTALVRDDELEILEP